MQEPKTRDEKIDHIWMLLAGVDNDGVYYQMKHLSKRVEEFINNTDNFRVKTCPNNDVKKALAEHLSEHAKIDAEKGKKTEFVFKKWHLIIAFCGIMISIASFVFAFLK